MSLSDFEGDAGHPLAAHPRLVRDRAYARAAVDAATAQLAAAQREATRARLSAAMGKGQPPSDAPLPGSGSNFWAWRTGPEGRRVLRDRAKQIDSLYSHDRKGVARSVDETEHEIRAREASLQVTRRAKKGIPAQPVDAAMLDHFAAVRSRVTAR